MASAPRATSDRAGSFLQAQGGPEAFWAFHPKPLPPDPPCASDVATERLLERANQALGRLDGVTLLLPDPDQFIYSFVRKEAVLSSQIEGTQSSLSDLLLFENDAAPGVPRYDAEETFNYIDALDYGVGEILRDGGLPLSSRLLREVHSVLLRSGRGADKNPGEFRRDQNWIGGSRPWNARYVPPPWPEVVPAMGDLEKYLHGDESPVLVRAALAHAQFESIHPFLDGNGRLGRMLITLLLCERGVLRSPLLYLSLYLKRNRDAYYEHLQRVRTDGEWEAWLRFFLEGVVEVAESTTATTRQIVEMVERDRRRIQELGRGAATALRVHDHATHFIVFRVSAAAQRLNLTDPPVQHATRRLEEMGILDEITGRQRGRLYAYGKYLAILNEGTTEPV